MGRWHLHQLENSWRMWQLDEAHGQHLLSSCPSLDLIGARRTLQRLSDLYNLNKSSTRFAV